MITFLWPWAFGAAVLPLAVRYLSPPVPKSLSGALRVPFFARLTSAAQGPARHGLSHWAKLATLCLIWACLITALARPAIIGPELALPSEGRDIMLAIDLSGSMAAEDFALGGRAVTRLDVVKEAADDFISRRKGDRIGLVLFSDRAYVQSPLTPDRNVVRALLDDAQVGLTGTETAIGDAIAIAVKRLKDRPAQDRVLILLTDGANNAGVMQPERAAELARDLGVRIYTIGVGADQMAVDTSFGRQVVNPSEGLDEATLTKIADTTGGQYYRAKDVTGLAGIYAQIDKIEPVAADPQNLRPVVAEFHWPLGTALVLACLLTLAYLARRIVRAVPKEITP